MNNQMQFRFFPTTSRTLLQALLLSAKTMTIFPLALRLAPQNTKNIIRTREKKDNKDFSTNTHRGTHSLREEKKGNVMYILLLRWFSSTLLLLFRRTLSAEAQQRSANVVFRSIEENCQIFLRFPVLKTPTSQQNFSFFLLVCHGLFHHTHTHTLQPTGVRGSSLSC